MKSPKIFPESRVETTTGGPDFPGSSGDRERGKFRPSLTPRLDTVAVVGDDGQPIAMTTDQLLTELIQWQQATVLALSLLSHGAEFEVEDVVGETE